MQILIVLAVLIGLYFLAKYKIVKFFTGIRSKIIGISGKYVDVNLKTQTRTYSQQVQITEHTRYNVLPKMGVFDEVVKSKFQLYLDLLATKGDPTENVTGASLSERFWTVIQQNPGKEDYRGIDQIMLKFFDQYRELDIKLPMIEFLYAIKSGVDSND